MRNANVFRLKLECQPAVSEVIRLFGASESEQKDDGQQKVGFALPAFDTMDEGKPKYPYLNKGTSGKEYFRRAMENCLKDRNSPIHFSSTEGEPAFREMELPKEEKESSAIAKTCHHKLFWKGRDYLGFWEIPPLGIAVSSLLILVEGHSGPDQVLDYNADPRPVLVFDFSDITQSERTWCGWNLSQEDQPDEARKVALFIDYWLSPQKSSTSAWRKPCMSPLDHSLVQRKIQEEEKSDSFDPRQLATLERFFIENHRGMLLDGPPGTGKTTVLKTSERIGRGFTIPHKPRLACIMPGNTQGRGLVGDDTGIYEAIFQRGTSAPWLPMMTMIDECEEFALSRFDKGGGAEKMGPRVGMILGYWQGATDVENMRVIGATNLKSKIDPAVQRRFGVAVYVGLPGWKMRANWPDKETLEPPLAKFLASRKVRRKLAELTLGMSQANLGMLFRDLKNKWKEMGNDAAEALGIEAWHNFMFQFVDNIVRDRCIKLGSFSVKDVMEHSIDPEFDPMLQYVGVHKSSMQVGEPPMLSGVVLVDIFRRRIEMHEEETPINISDKQAFHTHVRSPVLVAGGHLIEKAAANLQYFPFAVNHRRTQHPYEYDRDSCFASNGVVRIYAPSNTSRPLGTRSALRLILELAHQRELHVCITDASAFKAHEEEQRLEEIRSELENMNKVCWIVMLDAAGARGGDRPDVNSQGLLNAMVRLRSFAHVSIPGQTICDFKEELARKRDNEGGEFKDSQKLEDIGLMPQWNDLKKNFAVQIERAAKVTEGSKVVIAEHRQAVCVQTRRTVCLKRGECGEVAKIDGTDAYINFHGRQGGIIVSDKLWESVFRTRRALRENPFVNDVCALIENVPSGTKDFKEIDRWVFFVAESEALSEAFRYDAKWPESATTYYEEQVLKAKSCLQPCRFCGEKFELDSEEKECQWHIGNAEFISEVNIPYIQVKETKDVMTNSTSTKDEVKKLPFNVQMQIGNKVPKSKQESEKQWETFCRTDGRITWGSVMNNSGERWSDYVASTAMKAFMSFEKKSNHSLRYDGDGWVRRPWHCPRIKQVMDNDEELLCPAKDPKALEKVRWTCCGEPAMSVVCKKAESRKHEPECPVEETPRDLIALVNNLKSGQQDSSKYESKHIAQLEDTCLMCGLSRRDVDLDPRVKECRFHPSVCLLMAGSTYCNYCCQAVVRTPVMENHEDLTSEVEKGFRKRRAESGCQVSPAHLFLNKKEIKVLQQRLKDGTLQLPRDVLYKDKVDAKTRKTMIKQECEVPVLRFQRTINMLFQGVPLIEREDWSEVLSEAIQCYKDLTNYAGFFQQGEALEAVLLELCVQTTGHELRLRKCGLLCEKLDNMNMNLQSDAIGYDERRAYLSALWILSKDAKGNPLGCVLDQLNELSKKGVKELFLQKKVDQLLTVHKIKRNIHESPICNETDKCTPLMKLLHLQWKLAQDHLGYVQDIYQQLCSGEGDMSCSARVQELNLAALSSSTVDAEFEISFAYAPEAHFIWTLLKLLVLRQHPDAVDKLKFPEYDEYCKLLRQRYQKKAPNVCHASQPTGIADITYTFCRLLEVLHAPPAQRDASKLDDLAKRLFDYSTIASALTKGDEVEAIRGAEKTYHRAVVLSVNMDDTINVMWRDGHQQDKVVPASGVRLAWQREMSFEIQHQENWKSQVEAAMQEHTERVSVNDRFGKKLDLEGLERATEDLFPLQVQIAPKAMTNNQQLKEKNAGIAYRSRKDKTAKVQIPGGIKTPMMIEGQRALTKLATPPIDPSRITPQVQRMMAVLHLRVCVLLLLERPPTLDVLRTLQNHLEQADRLLHRITSNPQTPSLNLVASILKLIVSYLLEYQECEDYFCSGTDQLRRSLSEELWPSKAEQTHCMCIRRSGEKVLEFPWTLQCVELDKHQGQQPLVVAGFSDGSSKLNGTYIQNEDLFVKQDAGPENMFIYRWKLDTSEYWCFGPTPNEPYEKALAWTRSDSVLPPSGRWTSTIVSADGRENTIEHVRFNSLGFEVEEKRSRLIISKVLPGLVQQWNDALSDQSRCVSVGDQILEVNGVKGSADHVRAEIMKAPYLRMMLRKSSSTEWAAIAKKELAPTLQNLANCTHLQLQWPQLVGSLCIDLAKKELSEFQTYFTPDGVTQCPIIPNIFDQLLQVPPRRRGDDGEFLTQGQFLTKKGEDAWDKATKLPSRIAMKSHHGKYINVQPDGRLMANGASITGSSIFQVECRSAGAVWLRSTRGQDVLVDSDGSLRMDANNASDFCFEPCMDDGAFIVKTSDGRCIQTEEHGGLWAQSATGASPSKSAWFQVESQETRASQRLVCGDCRWLEGEKDTVLCITSDTLLQQSVREQLAKKGFDDDLRKVLGPFPCLHVTAERVSNCHWIQHLPAITEALQGCRLTSWQEDLPRLFAASSGVYMGTPLHHAVQQSKHWRLELLLKTHRDALQYKDSEGYTVLDVAAQAMEKTPLARSMVQCLLEHGAKPARHRSDQQFNFMEWAVGYPDMIPNKALSELTDKKTLNLMGKLFHIFSKAINADDEATIVRLISAGAQVNTKHEETGNSALHYVAQEASGESLFTFFGLHVQAGGHIFQHTSQHPSPVQDLCRRIRASDLESFCAGQFSMAFGKLSETRKMRICEGMMDVLIRRRDHEESAQCMEVLLRFLSEQRFQSLHELQAHLVNGLASERQLWCIQDAASQLIKDPFLPAKRKDGSSWGDALNCMARDLKEAPESRGLVATAFGQLYSSGWKLSLPAEGQDTGIKELIFRLTEQGEHHKVQCLLEGRADLSALHQRAEIVQLATMIQNDMSLLSGLLLNTRDVGAKNEAMLILAKRRVELSSVRDLCMQLAQRGDDLTQFASAEEIQEEWEPWFGFLHEGSAKDNHDVASKLGSCAIEHYLKPQEDSNLDKIETLYENGCRLTWADSERAYDELANAIRAGNMVNLEHLLQAKANPNATHRTKGTALHTAAQCAELEALGLLIKRRADVACTDARRRTALMCLCNTRSDKGLLDKTYEQKKTLREILLQLGCENEDDKLDVVRQRWSRETPSWRQEVLRSILQWVKRGTLIQPKARGSDCAMLLRKLFPREKNGVLIRELDCAAESASWEATCYLAELSKEDSRPSKALKLAILAVFKQPATRDTDCAAQAAEAMASKGLQLPYTREQGTNLLVRAIQDDRKDLVKLLLMAGVDPDGQIPCPSLPGLRVLHVAASNGSLVVFETLLRAKANLEARQFDEPCPILSFYYAGHLLENEKLKSFIHMLVDNNCETDSTKLLSKLSRLRKGNKPKLDPSLHDLLYIAQCSGQHQDKQILQEFLQIRQDRKRFVPSSKVRVLEKLFGHHLVRPYWLSCTQKCDVDTDYPLCPVPCIVRRMFISWVRLTKAAKHSEGMQQLEDMSQEFLDRLISLFLKHWWGLVTAKKRARIASQPTQTYSNGGTANKAVLDVKAFKDEDDSDDQEDEDKQEEQVYDGGEEELYVKLIPIMQTHGFAISREFNCLLRAPHLEQNAKDVRDLFRQSQSLGEEMTKGNDPANIGKERQRISKSIVTKYQESIRYTANSWARLGTLRAQALDSHASVRDAADGIFFRFKQACSLEYPAEPADRGKVTEKLSAWREEITAPNVKNDAAETIIRRIAKVLTDKSGSSQLGKFSFDDLEACLLYVDRPSDKEFLQLASERCLERKPPKHWMDGLKDIDTSLFFLKYIAKEDIGLTYKLLEEKSGAGPLIKNLLEQAWSTYSDKTPLVNKAILREATLPGSSHTRIEEELSSSDPKESKMRKYLRDISYQWYRQVKKKFDLLCLPHHTQIFALQVCAYFMQDTWHEAMPSYEQSCNCILGKMGTGEGKSIVIACAACYAASQVPPVDGGIMHVHVVVDDASQLERDFLGGRELFQKFGVKAKMCLSVQHKKVLQDDQPDLKNFMDVKIDPDPNSEVQIVYCEAKHVQALYAELAEHDVTKLQKYYKNAVLILDEVDGLIMDKDINEPYVFYSKPLTRFATSWAEATQNKQSPSEPHNLMEKRVKQALEDAWRKTEPAGLRQLVEVQAYDRLHNPERYVVREKDGRRNDQKWDVVCECANFRIPDCERDPEMLKQVIFKEKSFVTSRPKVIGAYKRTVGLSGSIGSQVEQKFLVDVFNARFFEVPPFLKTCPDNPKQEVVCRDVAVEDTQNKQLERISQLAFDYCKRVPVLIIAPLTGDCSGTPSAKQMFLHIEKKAPPGYLIQELTKDVQECDPLLYKQRLGKSIEKVKMGDGTDMWPITVTCPAGGRGKDYQLRDPKADENGGLLVIITQMPTSQRELIQYKGRTARQDRRGQFAYILHQSDYPGLKSDSLKKKARELPLRLSGLTDDINGEYSSVGEAYEKGGLRMSRGLDNRWIVKEPCGLGCLRSNVGNVAQPHLLDSWEFWDGQTWKECMVVLEVLPQGLEEMIFNCFERELESKLKQVRVEYARGYCMDEFSQIFHKLKWDTSTLGGYLFFELCNSFENMSLSQIKAAAQMVSDYVGAHQDKTSWQEAIRNVDRMQRQMEKWGSVESPIKHVSFPWKKAVVFLVDRTMHPELCEAQMKALKMLIKSESVLSPYDHVGVYSLGDGWISPEGWETPTNVVENGRASLLKALEEADFPCGACTLYQSIEHCMDAMQAWAYAQVSCTCWLVVLTDLVDMEQKPSNSKWISPAGGRVPQNKDCVMARGKDGNFRKATVKSLSPGFDFVKHAGDVVVQAKGERYPRPVDLIHPVATCRTVDDQKFLKTLLKMGARSGDVTVSLFWNSPADLDLHVGLPTGRSVYHACRRVDGALLDKDDRGGIGLVGPKIENVFCQDVHATDSLGNYTVSVNLFSRNGDRRPIHFQCVLRCSPRLTISCNDGTTRKGMSASSFHMDVHETFLENHPEQQHLPCFTFSISESRQVNVPPRLDRIRHKYKDMAQKNVAMKLIVMSTISSSKFAEPPEGFGHDKKAFVDERKMHMKTCEQNMHKLMQDLGQDLSKSLMDGSSPEKIRDGFEQVSRLMLPTNFGGNTKDF